MSETTHTAQVEPWCGMCGLTLEATSDGGWAGAYDWARSTVCTGVEPHDLHAPVFVDREDWDGSL